MSLPVSLLLGFLLSSFIGLFAYQRGSLTRSGVVGAILTGTIIFGFGGFVPGVLLVAFFVSSTLLSKYKARAKASLDEKFQKGSRRDFGQAMANGSWAAFLAVGIWFTQTNPVAARADALFFLGFVGAIATVTADTWATEIGVLSKSLPRMITTGRVAPTGTSGGITLLGTAMAFCGGAFIGFIASFFTFGVVTVLDTNNGGSLIDLQASLDLWFPNVLLFVLVGCLSGLLGSLFDSFLGATVQGIYFSEYDEQQTERQFDSQGSPTRLIRGWRWLNNDGVNFLASVFGSFVAAAFGFLIL